MGGATGGYRAAAGERRVGCTLGLALGGTGGDLGGERKRAVGRVRATSLWTQAGEYI